jgi:hypothetical protein
MDKWDDLKVERTDHREQKRKAEKRFRPDNRRSIRILALLSVRPRPQKGKRK